MLPSPGAAAGAAADAALLDPFANLGSSPAPPNANGNNGTTALDNPFLGAGSEGDLLGVAELAAAVPSPFAVAADEESSDDELNPDYMPPEQAASILSSSEELPTPTPTASTAGGSTEGGAAKTGGNTLVLSRQDTWQYLQDLQGPNWHRRVECTRAIKFLAFNADAEYKEGLIKGGLCRVLMQMLSAYTLESTGAEVTAIEHAASCMYSMAREHQPSKLELIKLNAPRRLVELLSHDSKQLRLNSCAALYAISCAGRNHCRDIALLAPMRALQQMIAPSLGRNAQDDQMQLFASLLIVNLLHARGGAVPKAERQELVASLQRAYDDATEQQARDIIALGMRRLQKLESRPNRLREGMRDKRDAMAKSLSKAKLPLGRPSSAKGSAGGASTMGSSPDDFPKRKNSLMSRLSRR